MVELYRLTQYRKKQLGVNYPGYEIVEMWEHDWRQKWSDLSDDVRERIDVTDRYEPLNPSEAEEERRPRGSSTKSTGMGKSSAI